MTTPTKHQNFAIVDIETTGGRADRDRIIEIAIIVTDGKEILQKFESLVHPERTVPPWITAITGITNQMLVGAPRFYEVARDIVEITEGCIFVAHHARFDYSFIQQEFKDLGYSYQRPQLCTVKTSRSLLPGHKSYSLGKLSEDLGIQIENRHRAMGDAQATFELMQRLLEVDPELSPQKIKPKKLAELNLPPQIKLQDIQNLPEQAGVYFFYDQQGEILYIGKSKNIRKRVRQHFSKKPTRYRETELQENLHRIDYELTGNDLLALITESQLIKEHQPRFNLRKKRFSYPYGIFSTHDDQGYLIFQGHSLHNQVHPPLLQLGSQKSLAKTLEDWTKTHQLYRQNEFGLPLFKDLESPQIYNRRAQKIIKDFNYPQANMALVGPGRNDEEVGVVLIIEDTYYGHGFVSKETSPQSAEELMEFIPSHEEHRDIKEILLSFLRNKKRDRSYEIFSLQPLALNESNKSEIRVGFYDG